MNLQGCDRLRMLLMGAVAVGVIGPQMVQAGPFPTISKTKATTAQVKPTTASTPAASGASDSEIRLVSQNDSLAASAPGKKSEVMRQLEMLYEQDGREMPEMNTDIRPVPTNQNGSTPGKTAGGTGTQAAGSQAPPSAANNVRTQQPTPVQKNASYSAYQPAALGQNPAQPQMAVQGQPQSQAQSPASAASQPAKSKYPVIAFFKKLVPNHKDPKPTQAPADYRPDVAPIPPAIASQPPTQLNLEHRIGIPIANGNSSLPALDSQPRAPFVGQEVAANPLPKPLAELGEIPPSPNSELPLLATQAALLPQLNGQPSAPLDEIPPVPGASDSSSPFTEMSEAEADKKLELNPFTGLTLNPDAGSAKGPAGNVVASAPEQEDPFADELKEMGLLPPASERTVAEAAAEVPADAQKPSKPSLDPPTFDGIEDEATREKMKKIHERGGMKGLKGFCPVTLRDQRELIDAKPDFHSTFRGQKFHFADADAKLKFDEEPVRYAPAAYGADVVALTRDKDVVEGSLDFAAWFKGRLYLFGSEEAHDTFVADPSKYATPVGIE